MHPVEDLDKHEEFWFEDGDLVLLVDKVYFKVHRALLAHSCGLIRDMLGMPADDGQSQVEGSSIEHPVPIHDVAFDDFEVIIRDAYGRQPVIDFKPNTENMVQLARAAHRLQANRLLVLAATEAMKHLPPIGRLSLYRELDLDSMSALHDAERADEVIRRTPGASKRAADRGRSQRQFEEACPIALDADVAMAFLQVASSSTVTLPISGLDDKLNLRLVLARSALLQERRQRLARFLRERSNYNWGTIDVCTAVADLDVRSENFEAWYAKQQREGYGPAHVVPAELRTLFPTEAEDRAIAEQFWSP